MFCLLLFSHTYFHTFDSMNRYQGMNRYHVECVARNPFANISKATDNVKFKVSCYINILLENSFFKEYGSLSGKDVLLENENRIHS